MTPPRQVHHGWPHTLMRPRAGAGRAPARTIPNHGGESGERAFALRLLDQNLAREALPAEPGIEGGDLGPAEQEGEVHLRFVLKEPDDACHSGRGATPAARLGVALDAADAANPDRRSIVQAVAEQGAGEGDKAFSVDALPVRPNRTAPR